MEPNLATVSDEFVECCARHSNSAVVIAYSGRLLRQHSVDQGDGHHRVFVRNRGVTDSCQQFQSLLAFGTATRHQC